MARPETGREPVGMLRVPVTGAGDQAARRDPVRRDALRAEKADRTDRDRGERRDRREPREVRDSGRRDRGTARRDSQRLDLPREKRRLIRRPRFEDDAFGRFAEQFARFMGTARFLLYMTAFVISWLLYNWLSPSAFDPFPFIFLTLMLSLQASYAAPLILLAQNRQEDRDRVIGERDRMANTRAHADMEFLAREMASVRMALGEVATRDYIRSELRALLQELEESDLRGQDRPDRPSDPTPDEHTVERPAEHRDQQSAHGPELPGETDDTRP